MAGSHQLSELRAGRAFIPSKMFGFSGKRFYAMLWSFMRLCDFCYLVHLFGAHRVAASDLGVRSNETTEVWRHNACGSSSKLYAA